MRSHDFGNISQQRDPLDWRIALLCLELWSWWSWLNRRPAVYETARLGFYCLTGTNLIGVSRILMLFSA
jgi:hypothetical protein